MRRTGFILSLAIIAAACGFAASATADDDDYPTWQPSSDTATSITGPIVMFPDRFRAGMVDFPWRQDDVIAQFKPDQGPIPARVFQLTAVANPELLNGAKLCGDKAVNWIVMVPAPPNGLEIDAYSAADKPSSIASPGLCATFFYKRWG